MSEYQRLRISTLRINCAQMVVLELCWELQRAYCEQLVVWLNVMKHWQQMGIND
jgi:hypothetical protein